MGIERGVSASWSFLGRLKTRSLLEKPGSRIAWKREEHICDSGDEDY